MFQAYICWTSDLIISGFGERQSSEVRSRDIFIVDSPLGNNSINNNNVDMSDIEFEMVSVNVRIGDDLKRKSK